MRHVTAKFVSCLLTQHQNIFCKRIVGLTICLKYVNPSPETKSFPLGIKRHDRRPYKLKVPLLVQ